MSGATFSASACAYAASSASRTFDTPAIFAAASAAGRAPDPATRTCMSPAPALDRAAAAETVLSVDGFRAALSCSAMTRIAMSGRPSDDPGFVLQLVDQLLHGADLDAALAFRRLLDLERHEARRHVDAERIRRQRLDRLLLRLHDVRKRRITRLVEAKIGRHDGRQIEP